ncbi:hypothetical protein LTR37_016534 [Vermiconidia calcicola]|uniref:Uncharacterized protein n=1 Tax=Vermiconidia calcicola TaxID=1690605 RepID=A0ACC3MN15_9PEZI|nr:hypothetical protein LTR37_016534 [Vermiconidia calcicola]
MDRRPSAKDDTENFNRVLAERFPAVQQASRALQSMMGIEEGTQMLANIPVKLWQLPEPPKDTIHNILARCRRTQPGSHIANANQRARAQTNAEDELEDETDETEGSEQGLFQLPADSRVTDEKPPHDGIMHDVFEFEGEAGQGLTRRRPLQQVPPSRAHAANNPRVVIDLTDSPVSDPKEQPRKPQLRLQSAFKDTTTEKSADLHETASPPPLWQTPARSLAQQGRKPPIYWSSDLSMTITRWMEQSGTEATQTRLSHIELRRLGDVGAPPCIKVDARECDKVRLTRVKLPPSAQVGQQSSESLDWLVFEVKGRPDSEPYDDEATSDDGRKHKPPPCMLSFNRMARYWLLAFPLEAVTDVKVGSQLPAPVSPLQKETPHPNKRRPGNYKPAKATHNTTLLLGKQGKVPLVHGRGVEKRFADAFIFAFAEGKGVIEMKSSEAISLR